MNTNNEVYGAAPMARPILRETILLPLAQRAKMEKELNRFSRGERMKTIANMQSFGKDAMNRWFPRGIAAYLDECFGPQ